MARYKLRWLVDCDGDISTFASRAAAREHQAWLNRHPGNVDIRNFGPYTNVDGIARLVDLGRPNSFDGLYYYDPPEND